MPNNIIMADQPGGEIQNAAYVKIHTKEVVIGENNGVTNTAQFQKYLMQLSELPGTFVAFSASEEIKSPVNNDIALGGANGFIVSNSTSCYRYRNGWTTTTWNSSQHDAVAVPGRKVIVVTREIIVPT